MKSEHDPVERAQTVREKAAAGIERADELIRKVDELTERIQAHRGSGRPGEHPVPPKSDPGR